MDTETFGHELYTKHILLTSHKECVRCWSSGVYKLACPQQD